jgi:hypothetical protein
MVNTKQLPETTQKVLCNFIAKVRKNNSPHTSMLIMSHRVYLRYQATIMSTYLHFYVSEKANRSAQKVLTCDAVSLVHIRFDHCLIQLFSKFRLLFFI